jgi:diacylglycerol O-acyltransferase / wax synthase
MPSRARYASLSLMATQHAMPNADTAWLHMDQPTNLMIITSVLWFDSPVDWARVKEICRERVVAPYPRFRQRVVESRLPLRGPRFEDDPHFDLDRHLHHIALPAPGDRAALEKLVADVMATQLDHAKPLWDWYLVDGFGEGCAIVTRMHHCIADGVALARVLLGMTDDEPAPSAAPRDAGGRSRLASAAATTWRAAGALAREGAGLLARPDEAAGLARAAGEDARSFARIMLTGDDARSVLKGDLGLTQRAVWTPPIPLDDVKSIGRATGSTVNDVLVTAVAGALRRYLEQNDSLVDEIRAFVPFNLRPLTEPLPRDLGNKFSLVLLPLPVGRADPRERLAAVRREMAAIKRSADAPVGYAILNAIGLTPFEVEQPIIDLFSAKGSLVLTNVPGPRRAVYLAGTPVSGVLVWAPRSGSVSMSVSIFSYNGEVTVGLGVDAGLVPDPETILVAVSDELAALRSVARGATAPRRKTQARRRPGAQRARPRRVES